MLSFCASLAEFGRNLLGGRNDIVKGIPKLFIALTCELTLTSSIIMASFGFVIVFLDHDLDKKSVKKQIKKAIKVAKLHGTAIAIGHPHENTLAALRESKHLFKDVELVYIDRLY
jgi:hypothetical protein